MTVLTPQTPDSDERPLAHRAVLAVDVTWRLIAVGIYAVTVIGLATVFFVVLPYLAALGVSTVRPDAFYAAWLGLMALVLFSALFFEREIGDRRRDAGG